MFVTAYLIEDADVEQVASLLNLTADPEALTGATIMRGTIDPADFNAIELDPNIVSLHVGAGV